MYTVTVCRHTQKTLTGTLAHTHRHRQNRTETDTWHWQGARVAEPPSSASGPPPSVCQCNLNSTLAARPGPAGSKPLAPSPCQSADSGHRDPSLQAE
eukprot:2986738-Rhodomonas_salina.2